MNNAPHRKFYKGLILGLILTGGSLLGLVTYRASAQLGPLGTQILGTITSSLPTGNVPIITSPYVLDTANIIKNVNTNNWDIPYTIPPNTLSTNFVLQINGTTLTGVPQAQILNGQLVFKVPDSAFAIGGTAMIGLVQKNPFKVVSLNAVIVLAQGLQPSPFIFNQFALTQNEDGTWNIGYYIPQNTVVSQYALTVGNNPPIANGLAAYGGMIFKVPETWFTSGSVLLLKLTHIPTNKIVATNIAFVPESGPSPYILDQFSIRQNENLTWDVGYNVPSNTISNQFSLGVGNTPLVINGKMVSGKLVFKVPEKSLVPGSVVTVTLKNETTGQVRAMDTITVPAGLPSQYLLNFPPVQNLDKTWRVSYQIPSGTVSSDFVLLVGTTGTEIKGGLIVNDTLLFTIPENLFSLSSSPNIFKLKNIKTGKIYNADGTITQGTPVADTPDNSKYIGGLLTTFPPTGQNITQNQATIQATVRAIIDLPFVDTSYIWNTKDGDPATNTEKPLLKVPGPVGMEAGEEKTVTMTFANLSPGQTYTFVIKNKVTNTVSEVVEFKTPSGAGEKSYLSYSGGYTDFGTNGGSGDPNPVPAVVDDISDKGIVPPCGRTWTEESGLDKNDKQFQPCTYSDFMILISNVMRYALIIFGPIVALLACWTGLQVMWYGRLPDPTAEQILALQNAKARLVKIMLGLVIILSGWVIVATIMRELGVKEAYSFIDLFTGN